MQAPESGKAGLVFQTETHHLTCVVGESVRNSNERREV